MHRFSMSARLGYTVVISYGHVCIVHGVEAKKEEREKGFFCR